MCCGIKDKKNFFNCMHNVEIGKIKKSQVGIDAPVTFA